MDNYFQMNFTPAQVAAMSNVALAHVGDGVYSLMCRAYLCQKGDKTVRTLHRDSVELVKAPTQARLADALEPSLTEQERDYYRRGKNAHTHAAPRSATPREYSRATGLETLFGALYLMGQTERLNRLFGLMMEAYHGI